MRSGELDVKRDRGTPRAANNHMYMAIALAMIADHAEEDVQRFYLGGLSWSEVCAGAKPKHCQKDYLMTEIGRWGVKHVVALATNIARNPSFNTLTQKQVVDHLRRKRLQCKV
ncbi:MAG: hypothetical protein ABR985_22470 [Methanotrichaceae archaeon]|jgi:hypothetical protein